MHRTILSAAVLLACLLVAMPAMAQRYQWNSDRPDGHAPAGVKADFTLPGGEIYVGYRYFEEKFGDYKEYLTDLSHHKQPAKAGFLLLTNSGQHPKLLSGH